CDQDCDLDLLLVNFYGNVVLYRNNTDDKDWLMVKPVGRRSNPDGIGAKVSVFAETEAQQRLVGFRQVHSGAGYCRSSPLVAHFGLGHPAAKFYRVEVLFPGAKTPVVKERVTPGQRVLISE